MNENAADAPAGGSKHGGSGHWWILGGLVLGAVAGTTAYQVLGPDDPYLKATIANGTQPLGEVFLRLLLMTVVPLVFASLALGVAQLGKVGSLGRIVVKTFAYFIVTMACAVAIGLVLVNVVRPGKGLPEEMTDQLMKDFKATASERLEKAGKFGVSTFVEMIPRNPLQAMVNTDMLAVIVFALLVGLGITRLPADQSTTLLGLLEATANVMVTIIGVALAFAPVGVFALIFSTTAKLGPALLAQLGWYVGVVLVGLAIQMFVVFPVLVSVLGRMSPLHFFTACWEVIVTAFSTSSSNATLPTSIRIAEEKLGVSPPIAGFVLPLGATMNMNGTALFEGITALFLVQVFGGDNSFATQLIVLLLCVVTAVGAAGVPGGSLPLLAMVVEVAGVPGGAIALILGVDRLLDMSRTTLNVVGDLTAAVYIQRTEGANLTATPPG
jgi:DAACS family dicarboxylate/amino acid:cation (Na+ or H+) symporter